MMMSIMKSRTVLSYGLDWVIVIVVAAAGGVLNYIDGFHRPFALTDIAIAYPHKPDIVTLPVLIAVSLLGPVVVIFSLQALSVLTLRRRNELTSSRQILWETLISILGLCAGLAATLFVTSGLKDLIGKPRPHLLAICNADVANLTQYIIGGYGTTLLSEEEALVSSGICRQPDRRLLDDGFAAFPSGHSSFSSAGMVYLTLWLCARFSVALPSLSLRSKSTLANNAGKNDKHHIQAAGRNVTAPPLWKVVVVLTPIVIALFICSTRYADFHHAGIDIFAGGAIGAIFGMLGFRLYHSSATRGIGLLVWGTRHNGIADVRDEEQATTHNESYELRGSGGLVSRQHTHATETTASFEEHIFPTTPTRAI